MFEAASLVILSKVDLLPHLDFDVARAKAYIAQINPRAEILMVSTRTGEGMDTWMDWIEQACAKA